MPIVASSRSLFDRAMFFRASHCDQLGNDTTAPRQATCQSDAMWSSVRFPLTNFQSDPGQLLDIA